MSRTRLILVLCLSGAGSVAAQDITYEGGFERAVNRYRWNANLMSRHQMGDWTVAATNRYRSDAFLLFNDRLSFRDFNALRITATRPMGSAGSVVARGRSDWYSLSDVLAQSVYGGVAFRVGSLTVTPLLGVAMDRRPGARVEGATPLKTDAGPAIGAEFDVPVHEAGGYEIQFRGEGFREQISPRTSQVARFGGSAARTFEQTTLTVDLAGGTARRDAYQAASFLNRDDALARQSETVESTRSDTLGAALSVLSTISEALSVSGSLQFNANDRSVRTLRAPEEALFFDSDFDRRTVDAESSVQYGRGTWMARVGVQGGAEIERRSLANEDALPSTQASQKRDLLRQADYDRGYATLQANLRMPLSSWSAILLDGSANITRHDTPIINPDDRDEQFFSGRIGLMVRASPALEADIQLFASHYHTVYLKAARSAENNVQRGLRLRPSVRWRPGPRTRIALTSEVRATYTVDDFVLPGRRTTDQAARELRYDLEFDHDFGDGIGLVGEARLSDLRLGRFLSDVFAEIPIDTLKTYGGWLRLRAGQRVTGEIGIRVFIRTDFDRAATVRYARMAPDGTDLLDANGQPVTTTISRPGREMIAQVGPTCVLTWPMRAGMLRFEGWYTVQRVSRRLYGDLPEASAAAIQESATRGERIIIPNLALTMRWSL